MFKVVKKPCIPAFNHDLRFPVLFWVQLLEHRNYRWFALLQVIDCQEDVRIRGQASPRRVTNVTYLCKVLKSVAKYSDTLVNLTVHLQESRVVLRQCVIEANVALKTTWFVVELDDGHFGRGDGNDLVQVLVSVELFRNILNHLCVAKVLAILAALEGETNVKITPYQAKPIAGRAIERELGIFVQLTDE